MRSMLTLLIVIIIFILLSLLQEIRIRQSFVPGSEQQLIYVLPYISPACSYSSRYFEFEVPDCDSYSRSPALVVTGSLDTSFDDDLVRKKRLIVAGISFYQAKQNSLNDWQVFFETIFFQIRNGLYHLVIDSTTPVQAGLTISLLFGTTDWLNTSLKPYFENTGTLHILAASGSHVALIATFFTNAARFAPFKQKGAIIMSGIVFYQLLLGAAPSITRATGMALILLFSKYILFRKTSVTHSLVVATGCLLIWRPEWLLSIGFQLSVVATFGIIKVYPIISQVFRKISTPKVQDGSYFLQEKYTTIRSYIVDQLLVGLSAELVILPLLIFHFGSTPVLGFVATTAVAWFVPFLMNSLLMGVILSGISSVIHAGLPLAELISFLTIWLPVEFFLMMMRFLSVFNWLELGRPK